MQNRDEAPRVQDEGPLKHHGDKLEELIPKDDEHGDATPATHRADQPPTNRPSAPDIGE